MNVCGLGSALEQSHLHNVLRSLDLDVVFISVIEISGKQALASNFKGEEVFLFCCLLRSSGDVATLLWKSLNLQVRAIFLDLGGRILVLGVNDSENICRVVSVYVPTPFFIRLA